MLKAERHNRILELCRERGQVGVQDIADALDVSTMTVRRDLEELSEQQKLLRVHGGARSLESIDISTFVKKYQVDQKRLASHDESCDALRDAVKYIQRYDVVYLGVGATLTRMASVFPDVELRVVTNNMKALPALLKKASLEITVLGGVVDRSSESSCSPVARDMLESIGIDRAFVGADGICDGYAYVRSAEVGEIQKRACSNARSSYLVVEAPAVDRRDFYRYAALDGFQDVVISDGP